jgi:Zn-dependent protease with chaperone function
MNNCGGVPITQRDVDQTIGNLQSIFAEAQQTGLLPPGATLKIEKDYPGIAFVDGDAVVGADPLFLACQTKKQLKSIIMHEAGHYNDPLMDLCNVQFGVQSLFAIGITAIVMRRVFLLCGRYLLRSKNKFKFEKNLLTKALTIYSLHGAAVLAERRSLETRADLYSASVMGTGEPLIQGFRKFETTDIYPDDPVQSVSEANGHDIVFQRALKMMAYGACYFLVDDHPSNDERINRLRSYRPEDYPPYGMKLSAYYKQKIALRSKVVLPAKSRVANSPRP